MNTEKNDFHNKVEVRGELTRRSSCAALRAVAVLTGFILLRSLFTLALRFCLSFRKNAVLALSDSSIVLQVEWSILGRKIRRMTITAPVHNLRALQLENRQKYLYLLVGFGFLAIGTWLGIQWFVDGLRAGYPYLAAIGAGVVAAGVLMDLGLYVLIPQGSGHSRLALAMGPWKMTLTGVDESAARLFVDAVRLQWSEKSNKHR